METKIHSKGETKMKRDPVRQAIKIYSNGISGGIAITIVIFVAYQLGRLNEKINVSERIKKSKKEKKERD